MSTKSTSRLLLPLLLAVVLVALVGVTAPHEATASGSMPIVGYMWSGNAGWISFSGSTYGVSEDKTTGALSGYAWSSNEGWISFNVPDGTHPAPAVDMSGTGKISGWIRACAAFADKNACSGALDGNSGGWDGWIDLSGTAADNSTYGIVQSPSTCAWSGYAWGSEVFGAISAGGTAADNSTYGVSGNDPATCAGICANGANNPPTCSQCPNGLAYISSSCVACSNGGCTGTGGIAANPLGSLVCINGAINPQNCNAFPPTATLSASPATIDLGQHVTLTWSSTNATSCTGTGFTASGTSGSISTGTSTSPGIANYQIVCQGPNGASSPVFASVTVLAPNVLISAVPTRVKAGANAIVSWSASQVTSCTISGPGLSPNPRTDYSTATTSQSVLISVQSTYTISCVTNGSPLTASATVNVQSAFQEF